MKHRFSRTLAALAVVALGAAGCGASPGSAPGSSPGSSSTADSKADGDLPVFVVHNPAAGSEASSGSAGAHAVDVPDFIPACPGDTTLLAWAEIPNGWVLVCGVDESQPTVWMSEVKGVKETSNLVTYQPAASNSTTYAGNGSYTAELADGATMQLEFAPATLRIASASGKAVEQTSVLIIYFVSLGMGGQAQGEGAYGLEAPSDTADDQVRYLSELLATSYEGRAQLRVALDAVIACNNSKAISDAVGQVEDVRDNRAYLLSALAAAPVDQVPDGVSLLNELAESIEYSYQADVAYLEWAKAVRDGGCNAGSGSEGDRYSGLATPAKRKFADHWNKVIYPDFDVQKIDPAKL